jgi:hypothetical protein
VESNLGDCFGVLEVKESEVLHPDSRNHEVQNSKIMKSLVGEPTFAERIGVRHFIICEDKRSEFFVLEHLKL